jgi:hypothetical protein
MYLNSIGYTVTWTTPSTSITDIIRLMMTGIQTGKENHLVLRMEGFVKIP